MNREEMRRLVADVESWITGYLYLPDKGIGLVLALWAIGTWFYQGFPAYPYLAFVGPRGTGKSRGLDVLKALCLAPWQVTGGSAAALYRQLAAREGALTLLIDEAETTGSEARNLTSQFLNVGYKRGATIPKAFGKEMIEYPAYNPKAIASIADPNEALRSRCIMIEMALGKPAKTWKPWEVEIEGAEIVERIKRLSDVRVAPEYPEFLSGRDAEIWGAMFGMATALGLLKPDVERLTRAAADNAALKTGDRVTLAMRQEQDRTADSFCFQYAGRALADLRRVLDEGERSIFSAVAVERMRALPDGPWRLLKGRGLDQEMLAELLAAAGVKRKVANVKIKGKVLAGYKRTELEAAKG